LVIARDMPVIARDMPVVVRDMSMGGTADHADQ
jgi:hypothetical protein